MKKICLWILLAMTLCLTACKTDKSEEAAPNSNAAENSHELSEPAKDTKEAFELTDSGKAFLEQMCRVLSDFDSQAAMDETFWRDFLFYSYTNASSETAKLEQIYREDLGFEETVVKVSLQEATDYAKLVFGMELPDIKPSFEDMEDGQTSCYYQDGYYYIGVSDFPNFQYTFASCEESDTCITVKCNINFEGESNVGTVTFTLSPEDNENGFVIRSKTTELLK